MRKHLSVLGLGMSLFVWGCGTEDDLFYGNFQQQPVPVGLLIVSQSTQGAPNAALVPAFQVVVVDAANNVPPVNAPVTVTLSSNPTGATLSGTVTGNTTNGVITFTNLSINLKGTYRLTATMPGLGSVVSAPIQIGGGTPVLGAANNIAAGFGLFFIHSADLNKDGKLDMVAIHPDNDRLSVFLGNGAGGFGAPTPSVTGIGPEEFVFGDWNRDGNLDLAVTLFGNLGLGDGTTLQLFQGNGAGGFAAPTSVTVGTGPFDIAKGDFNGDGITDLVVSNFTSQNFSLLLGNGVGGFGAATNFLLSGVTPQPTAIAVADFNGDTRADVVVADNFNDRVNFFAGNGAGGFAAPVTTATGLTPRGLATADFNKDGRVDLVSANRDSNDVSLLLNNGAGFAPAVSLLAGTRPNRIVAVDFNGDGNADIINTNSTSDNGTLRLGQGNGAFGAAITLNTGAAGTPVGLDVADYNNDTNLDLGIANYLSQFLSIFLQTP